jgi:hypothetical protein
MDPALKQDEALQEVMVACYSATKTTCKVLFPDCFHLPFSKMHQKIFDILDDDSIQLAAIAAPRGFGKTSIVNMAYPAKKILFREKKFIVLISATATKAVMDAENLKKELLYNEVISNLFGPMRSDSFSKEAWITQNDVMVLPRGAGQQVRGMKHRHHRPDLIICDDLETAEGVMNDELRAKLKEWFFADVCNSIDRSSNNWKIIVIGTILHEDSLLANLVAGDVEI